MVQQHEQYRFVQVPPLAPLNGQPVPGYPTVYPTPIPMAEQYSFTQLQQAQFLFEKDKQTITPEAIKSVKAALASYEGEQKTEKKVVYRKAAGQAWADPTLAEWPQRDIVVDLKNNTLERISECHPLYLPSHYVLLFPTSDLSWSKDMKHWVLSCNKSY